MSPQEIRQRGARAFRARQRGYVPGARGWCGPSAAVPFIYATQIGECGQRAATQPAGPQPLRSPVQGETPLSPLEILHGIREGFINGDLPNRRHVTPTTDPTSKEMP